MADLRDVVKEITIDDFASIPANEDAEHVFRGLYGYLRDWNDPSKAQERLQHSSGKWSAMINRLDQLDKALEDTEEASSKAIRLTHKLQQDTARLKAIESVVSQYQRRLTPYTKFLVSEFMDRLVDLLEPHVSKIEKAWTEFCGAIQEYLERYNVARVVVSGFDTDTFSWLNCTKEHITAMYDKRFKEACSGLTKGAALDLETEVDLDSFREDMDSLIEELDTLQKLDEVLGETKQIASSVNVILREWG